MTSTHNRALWSALFVLAGACSGGGEEEDPQSSLTPVTRAIVGIIPAADIGAGGQPVDPGFTFPADAPKITIVAQAGEVTGSGSPMDLTWFQVTEAREEKLFTHTVEVGSFEAAYSVAKSPGTLTPGTYRVEATFEGESRFTQFEVETRGSAAATAPDAGAKARGGGARGGGATSGPPTSGQSGAVATPASDQTPEGVVLLVHHAPVDPETPIIGVLFGGYTRGAGGRLEGKATMGGSTRTVSYPIPLDDAVTKFLDFNPCAHPGGSDLPGTKATFEATVYKGNEFLASETQFTTLGPDTTKPAITIQPPPGRVERGDKILIDATAQENRNGPTWQTGVQTFQLTATPGGQVGEPQQARSRLPLPCDRKQWSLATQETYVVPADAPVIEICGIAEDFAGNVQTKCNKYYTGKVWKGTGKVTSSAVYPGPDNPTCRDGWKLEFTFVASSEGTINGQGTAELTSAPTCPFPIGPSWKQIEVQVLGEETASGFSLRFALVSWEPADGADYAGFGSMFGLPASPSGGAPVVVAVSGASGTGQGMWQFRSGNPPATYSANGTITLECVTCEEPVG